MSEAAKLVRRADAVRAKFRLLESVPGSGYHDDDRNVARPEKFQSPQRNGLPRCSEHVVFFTDHLGEEVVFAGEDAKRASAALRSWHDKTLKLDPAALTGTDRKLVTRILPRLAVGTDGLLFVRLDTWNDVLFALYAEGLGLSGLPLEE